MPDQNKITINPTSLNHAIGSDIIIRSTERIRLIFRAEVVNNPYDPSACVRGTFIYQKKATDQSWDDYKTLELSKLKKNEYVQIEIKSGELKTLLTSLAGHYKVFKKYGISWQKTDYIPTSSDIGVILDTLDKDSVFLANFIQKGGIKFLPEIIKWLSETQDTEKVIYKLRGLNVTQLEKVHNLIGISKIKTLLEIWEKNKNNSKEEYWQQLLEENSWLISQLFASPLVIFKDKAYMGGKGIDNKGGQIADYIFKNQLTDNIAVIELKTPCTELVSDTEYRDNVYTPSKDLSGGIVQLLSQKQQILNHYFSIIHKSENKFNACNPKCILICGAFEMNKLNDQQIESFDNFRNNVDNVSIITFDELFKKAEILIELLEDKFNNHTNSNDNPF